MTDIIADMDNPKPYYWPVVKVERSTTLNNMPREYVPYQLCPKCNGERVIPSLSTTNPTKQCDICGGLGIIPMAKI